MNTKISTLFLDIGGVILTNGWGRASRRLAAETFKLNYTEMDERHHLTFDTYELGKINLQEYLERVVFYEKREFTPDQFREFMFTQSQPFLPMIELITQLKAQYGLKIAVVSNEGSELNTWRINTFNLRNFVDFFISSCYVHFRKPDADIFRMAIDISQKPVQEILYIDDRDLFVSVAQKFGIQTLHHTDYKSTREKFAKLGLSIPS